MLTTAGVGGEAGSADYDLLRGGADVLEVALLAARSAGAARRVAQDGSLDADDKQSLRAVAGVLDKTARALEFFESGGREGSPPSGQFAARFDVAIEAVSHVPPESDETKAIAQALERISREVKAFVDNPTPTEAARLQTFFVDLASVVLRETGQSGETTSVL